MRSELHLRSANRLLRLCQDNGGCFIKVGQHIAALDYLLPEEYVQTMKPLRANAPEMCLSDVYTVLREDLKIEPLEVFSEFDEKPLGVASLAQVHKATLKSSGEVVAVKVQHRYVKKHSFVDIYTMDFLVRLVKAVFPQFEFMWLADEMRKNLPQELCFTQEGRNAEKVAQMLSHLSWLKVPKIHWTLSTDRVLTMEYCSGGFIDDVEYMKKNKIDLVGISKKVSQMFADMIYKHGFVHCDPHAGNILVRKREDGEDEVVLLDHGLYTQLTSHFRVNFSKYMMCIDTADVEGMKESAEKLNAGKYYGLMACMITGRSWQSIVKGIYRTPKTSSENSEVKENAARYLKEIVDILATVDKEMILIFKTLDLLRNISSTLGTQKSMAHQYQMGKAILACLIEDQTRECGSNRFCIIKAKIRGFFGQLYLWLWWSSFAAWTRRILGIGYA